MMIVEALTVVLMLASWWALSRHTAVQEPAVHVGGPENIAG